jgi:hypothetical protein
VKLSETPGIRGAIYRASQLKSLIGYAVRNAVYFARTRQPRNGHGPSIAQVVVGRNDDYMPDFLQRLTATIEWNVRHLVDEVVFVEWNPPSDRPLLSIELAKRFCCFKAYVVPPEIHQRFCENEHLALMEFHAKNVGIRRAQAPWIVATNADAAFGVDITYTFRNTVFPHDVIWTAQRIDIPWREMRETSIGLTDLLRYRRVIPYKPLGTGEFVLASRELWHQARGYDESLTKHRIDCDMIGAAQMIAHGGQTRRAGIVLHMAHPTSCTEGGVRPHHGEYAGFDGVPYRNPDSWGLGDSREKEIAERVWLLE